jgi:hypothetical protein
MNDFCPISREMVDENVVRLNAFFVFTIGLIFVIAPSPFLIGFLLIDFFIRAFWQQKFSPIRFISLSANKALKRAPAMVNAAPKVFAAKIGFFSCLIILIASLIPNAHLAARLLMGLLMVFAALESFFKYCVGCKMYSIYFRFFQKK